MKTLTKIAFMIAFLLGVNNSISAQCTSGCNSGVNLVANGDFSAGNVGFSSDLPFNPNCGGASYDVTTDATFKCSSTSWANVTGIGNYMVVDGASIPNQNIWYTNVNVTAGKDYNFSYWIYPTVNTPSYGGYTNRPILELVVDGIVIDSYDANGVPVHWTEVCADYTATSTGSVTIAIRQVNDGFAGWDYGIDSISYTECQVDPCDIKFGVEHKIEQCRADFKLVVDPMDIPYVTNVNWTFGDGKSGTGLSPSHYYENPGIYEVCVELVTLDPVSGKCCIQKKCFQINVEKPCEKCDLTNVEFKADLNASCCEYEFTGIEVPFTEIIGWHWDFGDGTTGTGQVQNHEFPGNGSYKVCLIVVGRAPDGSGRCCTQRICRDINVDCMEDASAIKNMGESFVQPTSKPTSAAISIYPNPADKGFTIEFDQAKEGNVSLHLMDANGKQVKTLMNEQQVSKGNYTEQFNEVDLPSGIYFLHLYNGGERTVKKLMIK